MPPILDLHLGDLLTLKKKHPCGGYKWEVVRVGMDIGIVCQTCNRRANAAPKRVGAARKAAGAGLAEGKNWSGRGDSNPRPPPWQGGVLPLNYFRLRRLLL